ncbi:hypothetical protein LA080_013575 [Diaporthe eres]|nr:hypothetical protein LA080_013575 [Diaporthe eres]
MASTPSTTLNSEDGYVRDVEAHTESSNTNIDANIYQAYQTAWDTFYGLPRPEYPLFQLGSQETYERLHRKLSEHPHPVLLEHFENEIRKDWNCETGELRLRLVASYLHDVFQEILSITI